MTVPDKWRSLPHLTQRNRIEWSAACPRCGEEGHRPGGGKPDRFRIFTEGTARGWCRRCGFFEWQDDEPSTEPAPIKGSGWGDLIQKHRQDTAHDRLLRECRWEEYMSMSEEHADWWSHQGIPREFHPWFQVGYHTHTTYGEAYTIPYFDKTGGLVNCQYRLPGRKSDKYRPFPGLPTRGLIYYPGREDSVSGRVLVVEGAKKAMVAWWNFCAYQNRKHFDTVIATVSKSFHAEHISSTLDGKAQLYMCYDPDVPDMLVTARASLIRGAEVYVGALPVKIDDYINTTGLDELDGIATAIKSGAPVRSKANG